jgi:hypothetical protein
VSCSGEGGAGARKEGRTGVGACRACDTEARSARNDGRTRGGGGKVLLGWLVVFRSLCLVDHPGTAGSALPVNASDVRAGLGVGYVVS